MSRSPSIPDSLHAALITRWRSGASASDLVEWIEATNPDRAAPIKTSRASVQRLIHSIANAEESGTRLQAIHRIRTHTTRLLDALDDIDDGLRACIAEVDTAQPAELRSIESKSRLLYRRHLLLHRDLRLAGITGAAADKLVEKYATEMKQVGAAIALQDAREDAGLPPELGEPALPESLFVRTPNLLESIPLESKPIDDSIRAEAQSEVAVEQSVPQAVPPDLLESIPLESKLIDDSIRAESQRILDAHPDLTAADAELWAEFEAGGRLEEANEAAGLPPEHGAKLLSPDQLSRVLELGMMLRKRAPALLESDPPEFKGSSDSIRAGSHSRGRSSRRSKQGAETGVLA